MKVSSDHRSCAVVGDAGHLHSGPARPPTASTLTAGYPPVEMQNTEGNVLSCACPPAIHDQAQNGCWGRIDATGHNLADVFGCHNESLLLPFQVEQCVV